ncbi:unnamed protein product [Effrenium voratum]|uniref:Multidrug and toxin extrusion protein n=1 Tax=Effrenium voratum TaxID=2562239 RepID=A0AA36I6S4_9DINO|nr:unnamed protein product [Effrenium voratum]
MAQNVFGFSLGVGVNSALNTLVSQSRGAGRLDLCRLSLQQAQVLCFLVAVPSMFFMWNAGGFFRLVGINPRTAQDAGEFVQGAVFVTPFHFLACATRSFLRALKLPRPVFYVSALVALCHPIWCYILVHCLKQGAFGAGLCVTVSNSLNFLLLTTYVAIFQPGDSKNAWCVLPWDLCREVATFRRPAPAPSDCASPSGDLAEQSFRAYLRVAVPSALLLWSEWWVYEAMALLAGLCGKTGLAAHTATSNTLSVIFMVPSGLGSATSAMVGHAIGEGSSDAARAVLRAACQVMLGLCLPMWLAVQLGRSWVARLYSSDPEVVATMEALFVVLGVFQLFDGLQTVLEGGLIGLGLQRPASRVKLGTMVLVRLLGAYVLSQPLHWGVMGIWVAGTAGMVVTVALYLRLVKNCNLELLANSVQQELVPA